MTSTSTATSTATNSNPPLLLDAIAAADVDTLRRVLKSMCGESVECSNVASKYLLIQRADLVPLDGYDHDGGKEGEEHGNDGSAAGGGPSEESRGVKRRKLNPDLIVGGKELISRYETCAVCRKRFDLTENNSAACQTHEGVLQVNDESSVWEDDDDMYYGNDIDPETDWRREEFPQGFVWSCCEGNADAEPCRVSRHVVVGTAVDLKPRPMDARRLR